LTVSGPSIDGVDTGDVGAAAGAAAAGAAGVVVVVVVAVWDRTVAAKNDSAQRLRGYSFLFIRCWWTG
jgi:hypothetical protein